MRFNTYKAHPAAQFSFGKLTLRLSLRSVLFSFLFFLFPCIKSQIELKWHLTSRLLRDNDENENEERWYCRAKNFICDGVRDDHRLYKFNLREVYECFSNTRDFTWISQCLRKSQLITKRRNDDDESHE